VISVLLIIADQSEYVKHAIGVFVSAVTQRV